MFNQAHALKQYLKDRENAINAETSNNLFNADKRPIKTVAQTTIVFFILPYRFSYEIKYDAQNY